VTQEETVAADQATHALHAQFEAILTGKETIEADQATHVLHAQTDTRRNSQSSSGTCFNSYQWCRSSNHDQCLLCLSLVACGGDWCCFTCSCSAVQCKSRTMLSYLTSPEHPLQYSMQSRLSISRMWYRTSTHMGSCLEQHSSTLQQYA